MASVVPTEQRWDRCLARNTGLGFDARVSLRRVKGSRVGLEERRHPSAARGHMLKMVKGGRHAEGARQRDTNET